MTERAEVVQEDGKIVTWAGWLEEEGERREEGDEREGDKGREGDVREND